MGSGFHAVWLLAHLGEAGIAEVEALLDAADPALRLTAFRVLRQVRSDRVPAYARRLVRDGVASLRREVAIALRDLPAATMQDLFLELADGYDGRDRWYLEALGFATAGKEEILYPLLRARYGTDPVSWDTRMAGLAWRLHPRAAVNDLKQRAGMADVAAPDRKQALVALGFIQAPQAAQAMAELVQSLLPDVAVQANWWMQYRATNEWHAYTVAERSPTATPPHRPRRRRHRYPPPDDEEPDARPGSARPDRTGPRRPHGLPADAGITY